jgi:hypothetical protein
VCEQITPPPDSVDALSDTTLQGELNDLIRRKIERETASLRTMIMRLQQSRSRLEEQHLARETHLLSQLDDIQKHIVRLQAVPFPLSLMHCNKCGEPFSENEAIHVADNCGAVSRLVRRFFKLANTDMEVSLQELWSEQNIHLSSPCLLPHTIHSQTLQNWMRGRRSVVHRYLDSQSIRHGLWRVYKFSHISCTY